MNRGAWWATVHGNARVRHNLVTTPPPSPLEHHFIKSKNFLPQNHQSKCRVMDSTLHLQNQHLRKVTLGLTFLKVYVWSFCIFKIDKCCCFRNVFLEVWWPTSCQPHFSSSHLLVLFHLMSFFWQVELVCVISGTSWFISSPSFGLMSHKCWHIQQGSHLSPPLLSTLFFSNSGSVFYLTQWSPVWIF